HTTARIPHHPPFARSTTTNPPFSSQRRQFSAGDVAGGLLKASEFLITNVHEVTGTPWFISIPLVAIVVGTTVRLPLTLYSHRMASRRASLVPLIQAETAMVGLGLRKKATSNLMVTVRKAMKKRTTNLFATFAINERNSVFGGLLSLPIFVSNIEVLRRMCGGPRGLLGTLLFTSSTPDPATVVEATGNASATLAADLSPSTDLSAAVTPSTADSIASVHLDSTLANGGCFWFPDLLVPDPYHILPMAVSAVLVMHAIPDTSAARRELFGLSPVAGNKNSVLFGQSLSRRIIQRTLLVASLAIGPVTMDLPCALHVYWLASASFSLAVRKVINAVLPLPKSTVRPCQGNEMPLLRPKPP
ncbi:60Kd inner membrane protein-domain-containing protein, partial [Coniella lustricola]